MNMPVLIAILLTLCFGGVAIYFSIRADRLSKLIKEQAEKLAGKDEFTNMVVHDLRAPISAIKNAAKLLNTPSTNLPPADIQKLLKLIHEQSNNLLLQVATILDAAKMENGRFSINKTSGDITKTIADAVTIFKSQADMKHVMLTFTHTEIPPFCYDNGYMTEVINNLLSNSLKFTTENGTITVFAGVEGTSVKLTVTDTGMGIPKDKQQQLFTKFTQAQTHSNPTTGTGLGLYIAKGIVEAHNGTISLISEEQKGTTVTILLPKDAAPTNAVQPASSPVPAIAAH